jgi:heptosyltransferase II
MSLYDLLSRLLPTRPDRPAQPARIVLVQPCCIGDVVIATAALKALRRQWPDAHLTWAVGQWSRRVVDGHDLIDDLLDTGPKALPVYSPGDFLRFVRDLRRGRYELAVSLVRSPLMSLALLLSGIPHRAGIDSAGRGFGYNVRAAVDPNAAEHEAEIYLKVVESLNIATEGCYPNVPVREEDRQAASAALAAKGVEGPYIVINPAGGSNPGMAMDAKRWPPGSFAALADRLHSTLGAAVVIVAGPGDAAIVDRVREHMAAESLTLLGELTFSAVGALAARSRLYIGNDTGLTHLAAAAGAATVMILGPSDPRRYAPYSPHALALWKPVQIHSGGVAGGIPEHWDWARDGIGIDEAYQQIMQFLQDTDR